MLSSWRGPALQAVGATCLLLLGILTPRAAALYAEGPGDWPMLGHDAAHTGFNSSEIFLKPPLRLKWSAGPYCSSGFAPVVGEGLEYVGAGSRQTVLAFNALTGAQVWTHPTSGRIESGLAVGNGKVYAGDRSGWLYALDSQTGVERWRYQASTGSLGIENSSPTLKDGAVFVGAPGHTYGINAETGAVIWSSYIMGSFRTSPAVDGSTVYIGENTLGILAFDAATGALKWRVDIDGYPTSPTVVGGTVYVGVLFGKLYALDAQTGTVLWSFQAQSPGTGIGSDPAVANGLIYTTDASAARVYAIDAQTGALRWIHYAGTRDFILYRSTLVVANGVVYVDAQSELLALDATTGSLLWSYGSANGWGRPAVANSALYICGTYDRIYAFETMPAPVSVAVPAQRFPSPSFSVTWTVPITWTGTSAAAYDVQYRDGAAGTWTDLTTSATVTNTTFTAGQNGHTYYFRARSRATDGSLGDWSDPVSPLVDRMSASLTYLPALTRLYSYPYSDTFSSPQSGWPANEDSISKVGYLDGEYQVLVKQSNYSVGATPGIVGSDFSMEVDARPAATGLVDYGLMFALNRDWTSYYYFAVRSDGNYSLAKKAGSSWSNIAGPASSAAINQGQVSNHLKVVKNGQEVRLYVNGRLLTTANDDTIGSGRAGLRASALGARADVRFDNFSITMPGEAISAITGEAETRGASVQAVREASPMASREGIGLQLGSDVMRLLLGSATLRLLEWDFRLFREGVAVGGLKPPVMVDSR